MLVLTRHPGQAIRIGNDVLVRVLDVLDQRVILGFEAPESVEIWREEIPFADESASA